MVEDGEHFEEKLKDAIWEEKKKTKMVEAELDRALDLAEDLKAELASLRCPECGIKVVKKKKINEEENTSKELFTLLCFWLVFLI